MSDAAIIPIHRRRAPEQEHAAWLGVVRESPAAVASHDRARWLGLFTDDASVCDPVGSAPHVRGGAGDDPLARFYDTFIAPNEIRFDVDSDYVGDEQVVRDVSIEISMSERCSVRVPTLLRYRVTATPDGPRIQALQAHWELFPMVGQVLATGLGGGAAMLRLSVNMLRHMGPAAMIGFAKAARSVGETGKARVRELATRLDIGDPDAIACALAPGARIKIHTAGLVLDARQWAEQELSLTLEPKIIAAGATVSARVRVRQGGQWLRGVGFFELDPTEPSGAICDVSLFLEEPAS